MQMETSVATTIKIDIMYHECLQMEMLIATSHSIEFYCPMWFEAFNWKAAMLYISLVLTYMSICIWIQSERWNWSNHLCNYREHSATDQFEVMAASERHKASKKKKTKDQRLKRGSKRYLHLLNFIATRREKKLEKRRTLDPSAKVTKTIWWLWW